jgi:hypothetical protein
LIENDEWKQHAKKKFQSKRNDFVEKVETLEAADEKEATEKLDEFLLNSPRNIQDPVWTRWASVSLYALLAIHSFVTNIFCFLIIKTNHIFIDNYCSIYFLSIAIKTHFKTNTYLCKVACTLISLMNERAEPILSTAAIHPPAKVLNLLLSPKILNPNMSTSILHPCHQHF